MVIELINFIHIIFNLITLFIFIRIILSWFPMPINSPIYNFYQFIKKYTDPILKPFKIIIPVGLIGIDLSPIIAIVVLNMIERLIIRILLL